MKEYWQQILLWNNCTVKHWSLPCENQSSPVHVFFSFVIQKFHCDSTGFTFLLVCMISALLWKDSWPEAATARKSISETLWNRVAAEFCLKHKLQFQFGEKNIQRFSKQIKEFPVRHVELLTCPKAEKRLSLKTKFRIILKMTKWAKQGRIYSNPNPAALVTANNCMY